MFITLYTRGITILHAISGGGEATSGNHKAYKKRSSRVITYEYIVVDSFNKTR
jgi:hypothetical protein